MRNRDASATLPNLTYPLKYMLFYPKLCLKFKLQLKKFNFNFKNNIYGT